MIIYHNNDYSSPNAAVRRTFRDLPIGRSREYAWWQFFLKLEIPESFRARPVGLNRCPAIAGVFYRLPLTKFPCFSDYISGCFPVLHEYPKSTAVCITMRLFFQIPLVPRFFIRLSIDDSRFIDISINLIKKSSCEDSWAGDSVSVRSTS